MVLNIERMDENICIIKSSFSAHYQDAKIYLGFNNTLPRHVKINVELFFKNDSDMKKFFDWWFINLKEGSDIFYAKLPLYKVTDWYLMAFTNGLTHTEDPLILRASMMVWKNKTVSQNVPPLITDPLISKIYIEGSNNNYIMLKATDPDSTELFYQIVTPPAHADEYKLTPNGVLTYSPEAGYVGDDFLEYRAFDGTHYSPVGRIDFHMTARGSEAFWVIDDVNHVMGKFITSNGKTVTVKEQI